MADKPRCIMSAADMERSLNRIALQILEQNRGVENLAIVGIHTCGVFLAKRIHAILEAHEKKDIPYGSLDISLYRDDWSLASQNPVVQKTDINFSIENQALILIDDVLYTGRTIRAAMDAIMDFGRPKNIQLAVLVDRGGRELPIQPDYRGLEAKVCSDEHINVLLKQNGANADEVVLKAD